MLGQRLAISTATASASPSSDTGTPDSASATTTLSSSAPLSSKPNLASRNRENQRLSRARRKDYISSLEAKIRDYERQGATATIEMQKAAREVMEENARLKELLASNICNSCRGSLDETNTNKKRKGSRVQGGTSGESTASATTAVPMVPSTSTATMMAGTQPNESLTLLAVVSTNTQAMKSPIDASSIRPMFANTTSKPVLKDTTKRSFNPSSAATTPIDTTTPLFGTQIQSRPVIALAPGPVVPSSLTQNQSDCCSGQTVCVPPSPVRSAAVLNKTALAPTNSCKPSASSTTPCASCCPPKEPTSCSNINPNTNNNQSQEIKAQLQSHPHPQTTSSSHRSQRSISSDHHQQLYRDYDHTQAHDRSGAAPDTTDCNQAVALFQDLTTDYDPHEIKRLLCATKESEITCRVDNGTLFKLLDQFSV